MLAAKCASECLRGGDADYFFEWQQALSFFPESNTNTLHCAAIAEAMPGYVLLRSFHLSLLGPSLFCPLGVWFSHRPLSGFWHIAVGLSGGRFLSQRQVVLLSGVPNCHG